MLNDLFRMYKKIIIAVLIILCIIVFWFFGCHRQGGQETQTGEWEQMSLDGENGRGYRFRTDRLEGTVVFGTRGYLVKDRTLPVTVNVGSKKKSFTGLLKVTLPGETGKGIAYQSAVKCKKGVSSKVVLNVPQLGNVSFFCFEILDQFGAVEISEMIVLDEGAFRDNEEEIEKDTVCIGVLCRNYDLFSYLNGMEIRRGEKKYTITLVTFTKDSLPAQTGGLQALSGIIIDDFDTGTLSELQKSCLKNWIKEEGGSLLIGTGTAAKEVLRGIDELCDISLREETDTEISFYSDSELTGNIRLDTNPILTEKVKDWEKSGESVPGSCYYREYGKGQITVLTYSLIDGALLQWTGRDQMVNDLFKDYLERNEKGQTLDETSLWYIKKSLYAFLNSQLPNTFYYGLFFIIYLTALGVLAYYLLRRIKRREYIWFVVPVISIFFTVCLMVKAIGVASEGDSSFSTLRVVDTAEKKCDIYFLYQNNEGEGTSVNLVPEVTSAEPMDYEYRNDKIDVSSLRGIDQDYTINNTNHGFDIDFEETVPGSSHLLKYTMDMGAASSANICFEPKVTADYSAFYGEVKNSSDFDFDKLVLIRTNQYVITGKVQKGETVKIEKDEVRCWSGYDQENTTFGEGDDTTVIGNLMEYLQQQYIDGDGSRDNLLVIGITSEDDFHLFSDDHVLKNHLAVYVNHFSLPGEAGEDYIANINDSCLDEEEVTAISNDILEENETRVTYSFSQEKVVWAMIRNRDAFQGTIYAYNYETGENDKILNSWDDCMYCENLEPYISEMNKMILTFRMDDGADYGSAPILALVTREVE